MGHLTIMNWQSGFFGFAITLMSFPLSAQAAPVVLSVAQSVDAATARCPQQITLSEESQPYEGGYRVTGKANLSSIANAFKFAHSDPFSVTWEATLKPPFQQCWATAGVKSSGESSSHLRARLLNGKLYLILDMTGLQDANGFTPEIVNQSIQAGYPVWSWAGTD